MKIRVKYARWVLIVASLICHIQLAAEESFYDRLKSLTTTNDTGPSPTDPRLKDTLALDSGLVAGVQIGMNMSEVIENWGKPKCVYSTCMGGPRIDYPAAALFFHGDRLAKVYLLVEWLAHRTITNSSGLLRTNLTSSEYCQKFIGLIDTNNAGPPITNSLPQGQLIHLTSAAGVTKGTRMTQVIQLWGKPRQVWIPRDGAVLGYKHVSLRFQGDEVKEIVFCEPLTNAAISDPYVKDDAERPALRKRVTDGPAPH